MTMGAPRPLTSGIAALDERTGGLDAGGTYIVVGAPGPAKLVAVLHFVHEGVRRGERTLLITNATARDILDVARAWGLPLESAWQDGSLQVLGFRDDFELRAIRSIEPEEVLEELDGLIQGQPVRIAVDPGTMFLTGGARTLLASAFVGWARRQPGTLLTTFSVDHEGMLPPTADWLVGATTARLILEPRPGGLHQITFARAIPGPDAGDQTVTVQLKAGAGLVKPGSFPARRGGDRGGLDAGRLLLVTLDAEHATDLEMWSHRAFRTDVVAEAFEAVARVQGEATYGSVLVHAPRSRVREAVQACRAMRPLTRAAIVFASDDAIRSTDRVHILEAGADDCLSGGLDFRELGVRVRQAIASGAKTTAGPRPASARVDPAGGRVSRETFASEMERRAADPDRTFFSLLEVRSHTLSAADLGEQLAALVRADEGDLVSVDDDRCLALLQGARDGQAEAFLHRLRARIARADGGAGDVIVSVLGHPADSARIEELLGAPVGKQA